MRALVITALTGLSGCSLVYDFGSFEGSGEQDAAPPDVNPANLTLERVLTEPLVEGSGCLPPVEAAVGGDQPVACAAGSTAVPVVIEGSDIVAGAVVTIDGMGFSSDAVEAVVSSDGTLIAFEIAVPVDTALPASETAALTVTVSQEGASPQAIDVEVQGLDEFVASSFETPAEAVAALAAGARYSTIAIDTPLELVGAAPFHLQATSSISIEQPVDARGRGFAGADAEPGYQIRRAGGCLGGGLGSTGGCGQQGGRAGPTGGGGGGGGNQLAGSSGGGGNSNGGPATASAFLVPLVDHPGRGGGGSGSATLGQGHAGGDGGGLIAMTSGGRIEIAAAIDVRGGAGDQGGGVACNLLGGPGGGGGAGGSILLRARSEVVFSEGGAMTLAGGIGGVKAGCAGGNGSVGRVRVDTPALAGDLAAVIAEPEVIPVTGAIIAPQSSVRSGPAAQTVALSGDTSNSPVTWLSVNDAVEEFNFEAERTVELAAGVNEICVHVTDPSMGAPEESRHCVVIAYLP